MEGLTLIMTFCCWQCSQKRTAVQVWQAQLDRAPYHISNASGRGRSRNRIGRRRAGQTFAGPIEI